MRTAAYAWLGVALLAVQGCANYLYTGEMTAKDSDGKERQVVMYWPKTDPLLGKAKAGPVGLLTECGVPIQFSQQPEGIVFRGTPGDDALANGETPNASEFVCGRFASDERLVDIGDGPVSFVINCLPVTGEFSAFPRSYIAARSEPYEIRVESVMERSLFGHTFEGPDPPPCSERRD